MKQCLFTITLGIIAMHVHAQTPVPDLQAVTDAGNKTTKRIVLGTTDDGFSKLQVAGGVTINSGLSSGNNRPAVSNGTATEIRGQSSTSYYSDDGFLRLSAGGGTDGRTKAYIDMTGYSVNPDMYMNIVLGTRGIERMRINAEGYIGIGVANPTAKLDVNGSIVSNGWISSSGSISSNGSITSSVSADLGGSISLVNPAKTTPGTATRWSIYNMSGSYGNSLQFWAYDVQSCNGGMCLPKMTLLDNGNVGIGTTKPQSLLAVAGTLTAQRVKVTVTGWADYVFDPNYVLPPLPELEKHIRRNKHLPDIPAEAEIVRDGLDMGEMQQKQMKKIEELTLYLIEQNKKMEKQQQVILELNDRIRKLERK